MRYIPCGMILFALGLIENERGPHLELFHTSFYISNATCLNFMLIPRSKITILLGTPLLHFITGSCQGLNLFWLKNQNKTKHYLG